MLNFTRFLPSVLPPSADFLSRLFSGCRPCVDRDRGQEPKSNGDGKSMGGGRREGVRQDIQGGGSPEK